MLRTLLLAIAVTACSGNSSSDKELSDVRAELTDQRAEMRAMRQEIRELRDELHKPAADEPAGPEEEAAAEPPAATSSKPGTTPPPAAQPGKPAKPPAQGTVNIQVESNPAGATVYVADKKVGVTPIIVKAPVGTGEINVRLEKSGYRPRLMTLRPEEDTKFSVQLAKKSE